MFGNQVATIGEKLLCSAIVPNILSKKINIIPIAIPRAKFTPMPPLRFIDDTATAIMVRIKTDIGKLHRF